MQEICVPWLYAKVSSRGCSAANFHQYTILLCIDVLENSHEYLPYIRLDCNHIYVFETVNTDVFAKYISI